MPGAIDRRAATPASPPVRMPDRPQSARADSVELAVVSAGASDDLLAAPAAAPIAPAPRITDHAPVAAVVARAQQPVVATVAREARSEAHSGSNREIRIGEIFVELGQPLPLAPPVEHTGSLLAAIPRPGLCPRRRP